MLSHSVEPTSSEIGRTTVGIVEDDEVMGGSLVQRFSLEGYDPIWWRTGCDALSDFQNRVPDIVVCDIRLPDMSGEDVFDKVVGNIGSTPVVFITAFADIDQAVRLMRKGADEYLTKPFEIDDLLSRVSELVGSQALGAVTASQSLGASSAMHKIERTLLSIKDVDSNVMLTGESGSGKEVAARFLHQQSDRNSFPFIAVNCAAIPTELMESELFGHEAGAFTGATTRHRGYAERAGDGMLFLDEVSDLPFNMQGKLLQLIQNRTFMRVGGEKEIVFNARIICATNVDLDQAVEQGDFRKDLFYRLNVIPLTIPPLREHSEDILPLINGYVQQFSSRFQREMRILTPAAEEAALAYDWPGNVRELRNRVERAVALGADRRIRAQDLFEESANDAEKDEIPTLQAVRDAAEARHIRRAIAKVDGSMSAAASSLGVSRTTLWEKMKKLQITE